MKLKKYIFPSIIILIAVCTVLYFQHRRASLYESLNQKIANNQKEISPNQPTSAPLSAPIAKRTPLKKEQPATTKITPKKVVTVAAQSIPSSSADSIDPVLLQQAELDLVRNSLYEEEAKATLPTVSIQTYNPVWQLKYDTAVAASKLSPQVTIPIPAEISGPFGNHQPSKGEIWLRIPADNASEHRDIMAQNADLYITETGYTEPITVVLWVGGRPYARQQYE